MKQKNLKKKLKGRKPATKSQMVVKYFVDDVEVVYENLSDEENEEGVQTWYAQHFWNLVRVNGAWYHFDACPYCGGNDFFLWTDAQIDNFSALNGNCFERDKSLYPTTPG